MVITSEDKNKITEYLIETYSKRDSFAALHNALHNIFRDMRSSIPDIPINSCNNPVYMIGFNHVTSKIKYTPYYISSEITYLLDRLNDDQWSILHDFYLKMTYNSVDLR
jgi:hypothetical protein